MCILKTMLCTGAYDRVKIIAQGDNMYLDLSRTQSRSRKRNWPKLPSILEVPVRLNLFVLYGFKW
jgi:hypothetical protein